MWGETKPMYKSRGVTGLNAGGPDDGDYFSHAPRKDTFWSTNLLKLVTAMVIFQLGPIPAPPRLLAAGGIPGASPPPDRKRDPAHGHRSCFRPLAPLWIPDAGAAHGHERGFPPLPPPATGTPVLHVWDKAQRASCLLRR